MSNSDKGLAFWSAVVIIITILMFVCSDNVKAKGFQTDSLRVTMLFEIGAKGSAIDIFPFLKNITGSTFYFSALPDSARGIGLSGNWIRMLHEDYRFSGVPTAPGTDYRYYFPLITGQSQTDPTMYVGSQDILNSAIGLRVDAYDNYAAYISTTGGGTAVSGYASGTSSIGIAGLFIQTGVLTASQTNPTADILRVFVKGAYDATEPVLRVRDTTVGGTTGDLFQALVSTTEHFAIQKDSVTSVFKLKLANLDTLDTTVDAGTMIFDGTYGYLYDGFEWLQMSYVASGGVTITAVRSEIADSLDVFRGDSLSTWVTFTQLADSTAQLRSDLSGGITTFVGLSDTPADYTGGVGEYFVKVNVGADALEFVAGSAGVTDFTDLGDVPANYTDDAGKFTIVNAAEDALEFTHNKYYNYFILDAEVGQTDLDSAITAIQALMGTDFYTVYLCPGTYYLDNDVTIANCSIAGDNTTNKMIGTAYLGGGTIIELDSYIKCRSYTEIKNITITFKTSSNEFAAFYIEKTGNVVYNTIFDNVAFYDMTHKNLHASPHFIYSVESGNLTVKNCSFYGKSVEKYRGVGFSKAHLVNFLCENNYFYGMDRALNIDHSNTGDGSVNRTVIQDNIFESNDVAIWFEPTAQSSPLYYLTNNIYINNDEYDISFQSGVLTVYDMDDGHRTIDYVEGNVDFNYYSKNQCGSFYDTGAATFTAQTGYLLLGGKYGSFVYSEAAQTGANTTPTWYYDYTDSTLTIPSDWGGQYLFEAQIVADEGAGDDDYTWAVDVGGSQYSETVVNHISGENAVFNVRYLFKATGGEAVGLAVKAPNGNSAFDIANIRWTLTRVGDIQSIN